MEVTVRVRRAIIVDDDIDSLYIDTTTKDICRNKYPLLKRLEGGIAVDSDGLRGQGAHQVKSAYLTVLPAEGQNEC